MSFDGPTVRAFRQPKHFPAPLGFDGFLKRQDIKQSTPHPRKVVEKQQVIELSVHNLEDAPPLRFIRLLVSFNQPTQSAHVPVRCLRPPQLCNFVIQLLMRRRLIKSFCHLIQIFQMNGGDLTFAFPFLHVEDSEEQLCVLTRSQLDPQLVIPKDEMKHLKEKINLQLQLYWHKLKPASPREKIDFAKYREFLAYRMKYGKTLREGKTMRYEREPFRQVRQEMMQKLPAAIPCLSLLPYCVYYDFRDLHDQWAVNVPDLLTDKFNAYARTSNTRAVPVIYVDFRGTDLSMDPGKLYRSLLYAFQRPGLCVSASVISFEDCLVTPPGGTCAFLKQFSDMFFVPSCAIIHFTNSCFTRAAVERVLGSDLWVKYKYKFVF